MIPGIVELELAIVPKIDEKWASKRRASQKSYQNGIVVAAQTPNKQKLYAFGT